jgi:hypothetical protein
MVVVWRNRNLEMMEIAKPVQRWIADMRSCEARRVLGYWKAEVRAGVRL